MSATNFNTKNDTLRKLLGNGLTYRIPRFQRDYSWTEEEWEDLWADILGSIKPGGEPAHYMGYLVLQSADEKMFDVIDGQQRLTTMSLIVLAVLKNLQKLIDAGHDADRNKQRLEQIRSTYIGYLDPVTLVSRTKMTLNRNNNEYYQTYIVPLGHLPSRGFRASVHSLRKAFEWFEKRIGDHVSRIDDKGVALAQFIEAMSDKLFFTVITVTDELNAYKVFETLNARGVRLSSTDLLKNYLFSVLHRESQSEHEMNTLELRWEAMVGRLGSESFPDFLRVHWNSRFSFARQTELFKVIRGKVSGREAVFNLIRQMEEDLDTYMALTDPEPSNWPTTHKGYASDLRMFSVRQPMPLLLAARRVLGENDYGTLLKACVFISFRYNIICGFATNEQERVYNAVAEKISSGQVSTLADVLAGLTLLYPNDETFRNAFSERSIKTTQSRNKRIVRYVLCALEKRLTPGVDLDFGSDAFNLEHVLPENPESGWDAFPENELESLIYRLGNLTLMHTGANRTLGNASYAQKKIVYATSTFCVTRKIAEEHADWTPERLAARQMWMANQATTIWRIDQLS